jgi:hypothetical protein
MSQTIYDADGLPVCAYLGNRCNSGRCPRHGPENTRMTEGEKVREVTEARRAKREGREAEAAAVTVPDPFEASPPATREDCEIRQRAWNRPEKTCELVGKPKPKKADLNARERRWFEREGYLFEKVEKANPWGGVTQDLWKCFDYIAVRSDVTGVLFVQVTDKGDLSKRRRKILAAEATPVLLAAGNRIQIHAWHQPQGPGKRWEVKIEEITP